jgi:hypothetical protein
MYGSCRCRSFTVYGASGHGERELFTSIAPSGGMQTKVEEEVKIQPDSKDSNDGAMERRRELVVEKQEPTD